MTPVVIVCAEEGPLREEWSSGPCKARREMCNICAKNFVLGIIQQCTKSIYMSWPLKKSMTHFLSRKCTEAYGMAFKHKYCVSETPQELTLSFCSSLTSLKSELSIWCKIRVFRYIQKVSFMMPSGGFFQYLLPGYVYQRFMENHESKRNYCFPKEWKWLGERHSIVNRILTLYMAALD